MMSSYAAPSGRSSGTIGGTYPLASGFPRADTIDTRPSTPSVSCSSVVMLRNASSCGFLRRSGPSTTARTSYSLDGKRWSISSYWRNSAELLRNSSDRLSSTLSRSIPSPARTVNNAMSSPTIQGCARATRPPRSKPKETRCVERPLRVRNVHVLGSSPRQPGFPGGPESSFFSRRRLHLYTASRKPAFLFVRKALRAAVKLA